MTSQGSSSTTTSALFTPRQVYNKGIRPLYFCCGIQHLVDDISSMAPAYNKWQMDDGGVVAPAEVLARVRALKSGSVLTLRSASGFG